MKFYPGFLLSISAFAGCASAFAPTGTLPLRQSRAAAACSTVMLSPGEQFPEDIALKLGVKGKNAVRNLTLYDVRCSSCREMYFCH